MPALQGSFSSARIDHNSIAVVHSKDNESPRVNSSAKDSPCIIEHPASGSTVTDVPFVGSTVGNTPDVSNTMDDVAGASNTATDIPLVDSNVDDPSTRPANLQSFALFNSPSCTSDFMPSASDDLRELSAHGLGGASSLSQSLRAMSLQQQLSLQRQLSSQHQQQQQTAGHAHVLKLDSPVPRTAGTSAAATVTGVPAVHATSTFSAAAPIGHTAPALNPNHAATGRSALATGAASAAGAEASSGPGSSASSDSKAQPNFIPDASSGSAFGPSEDDKLADEDGIDAVARTVVVRDDSHAASITSSKLGSSTNTTASDSAKDMGSQAELKNVQAAIDTTRTAAKSMARQPSETVATRTLSGADMERAASALSSDLGAGEDLSPLPDAPADMGGVEVVRGQNYTLEVSNEAGYLASLKLEATFDASPEVLWSILTNPDNAALFRDIKAIPSRHVLAESDDGRYRRVRVHQVAEAVFWMLHKEFHTKMEVVEDARDPNVFVSTFKLLRSDMMSRFGGSWRVERLEGSAPGLPADSTADQASGVATADRCRVILLQDVLPRGVPAFVRRLPLLGSLLRGVIVRAVKRLAEDIQAVVAETQGGMPVEEVLRRRERAYKAANPSVQAPVTTYEQKQK